MKNTSRRSFLKTGAVATTGLMIIPGSVLGKSFGYTVPSDKLNIAGISVGGMRRYNLAGMNAGDIVTLCDVDWHYADKTFKDYPKAKRFRDWCVMFDEMGKSINATIVATPDHTHAGMTAHVITLGRHCYTQKPLTHSIYESRLLTKLTKKHKIATQMGNQGNSFDWCRQIAEWIQSGVVGDVYEVHCWTDRPTWPQGLMKPNDTPKYPKTLGWDLWINPAQKRPYSPVYTPWSWHEWWDFGTGTLGDMACHIMDPLYWALDLKYPTSVIGNSTLSNLYSPPHAQIIAYTFPAHPPKGNVKMPEVKVYWCDGGLMLPRPEGLKDGQMIGDKNGDIIFVGTKGKVVTDCYGMNPALLSVSDMGHFNQPKPTIPRVKDSNGDMWSTNAHEQGWIRACKKSPENHTEAPSNFQFSGPSNEIVVMGVLAVRLSELQGLHRELQWDGENMRSASISPNDKIKIITMDDFKVVDGDPRFDRRFVEFNAAEMTNEWIKHTYNSGFSLPDMPK